MDDDLTDAGDDKPTECKEKTRQSIASHYFKEKRIVFISLDVESGGDLCGLLQLSACFYDQESCELTEAFNEYVQPDIWNPHASLVHKLTREDPRIRNAVPMWCRFVDKVESIVKALKRGMIVAWNGYTHLRRLLGGV